MPKIVDIQKDLPELNRQLDRLDQLERKLLLTNKKLESAQQRILVLEGTQEVSSVNNIVLVWDGPNLKATWVGGHVKDRAGRVYSVAAGEQPLAASTTYWVAYNPPHAVLAFNLTLEPLLTNKNNLVLFTFRTGAGGDSGTAGGGGSYGGGDDLGGEKYSLFII